ncbi:uncharacterized protein N7515_006966 [Penicillium bovifimosum]|uniref:Uncharacterized protein n=1 Tax=Penicillium bovifimosum TaxID=126998 RepID=A0A9W9GVR5_9EURO|nr:uncharacterized protein N7515_006966 [Penicillium bovifimosum]KAJ5130927.1 hypothetical protein N7515_006966 [Penicillium bovifimosum]
MGTPTKRFDAKQEHMLGFRSTVATFLFLDYTASPPLMEKVSHMSTNSLR